MYSSQDAYYDDDDRGEPYDPKPRSGLWKKILIGAAIVAGVLIIGMVGLLIAAMAGLPDFEALRKYEPPVTTRVHAGDGALVAEFAEEHRLFVPIEAIPKRVQDAFVSAEDARFFEHSGIDYAGVMRAVMANLGNVLTGRRLEGASTITQQVAGNMLTGRASECSEGGVQRIFCALYTKVREGLAAQRIEEALDKNRILELYLNEIYLGNRAYGVAAAALNYFDKPLDELTIGEAAFLAVLPKGPANYDPRVPAKRERALARRNYVIGRMLENGYISQEEAAAARNEPLHIVDRLSGDTYVAAAPFVEALRLEAIDLFGERDLYGQGLSIRSTMDTRLQLIGARSLRRGLEQYDRRHGWRGPVSQGGDPNGDIASQLANARRPPAMTGWHRAMVTRASGTNVQITTETGARGRLSADDAQWAANGSRGAANRERALRAGSIIYVLPGSNSRFTLKQKPEVQGALVAMDPHTGRVLAMIGGYDLSQTGLNRARSQRQPGSSFKPIVYAAALDSGDVTPATLIDDSPLAIEAGDGSVWSPENYTREFYGPTTLRRGLEQSRNAMTARVAYTMGVDRVVQYARALGVYGNDVQAVFSLALGSGETSVLRMTTAYSIFVNGGRRVTPIFIDRVQDRSGRSIYRADQRECPACQGEWRRQAPPTLPDARQRVLDPVTAYQIVSMAEGVVQRGTATSVASLNRPLGGKTGTTNDYRDAWFIGFSPDLAVGVWVGFDQPHDMGEGETGGRIAAPIFRDFMQEALRNEPAVPFRIPSGVRLVRIDAMTGLLPSGNTTVTITEAFRPGTEPTEQSVSSPFIFGGTEPIDPRVFQGVSLAPSDERQRPTSPQQPGQRPQQTQEELEGLY